MKKQSTVELNFQPSVDLWKKSNDLKLQNVREQIYNVEQKISKLRDQLDKLKDDEVRLLRLEAPKAPTSEERLRQRHISLERTSSFGASH